MKNIISQIMGYLLLKVTKSHSSQIKQAKQLAEKAKLKVETALKEAEQVEAKYDNILTDVQAEIEQLAETVQIIKQLKDDESTTVEKLKVLAETFTKN